VFGKISESVISVAIFVVVEIFVFYDGRNYVLTVFCEIEGQWIEFLNVSSDMRELRVHGQGEWGNGGNELVM
jgi:hypothetical protein